MIRKFEIVAGEKRDTIYGNRLFALTAAQTFLKLHFPEFVVHELRNEQPFTDKKDNLFSVWSGIATSADFGFKVWVKEMTGGFNK